MNVTQSMLENRKYLNWLTHLPRLFVGLVLLATGSGKMLDMAGFVGVVDAYQLTPHWISVGLAYTLPFIEFFTGVSLIINARPRYAAWLATLLHGLMLAAVSITLQRGIQIENCGCFGVFFARPLTPQTLFEDMFMLLMSIWVLINASRDNSTGKG